MAIKTVSTESKKVETPVKVTAAKVEAEVKEEKAAKAETTKTAAKAETTKTAAKAAAKEADVKKEEAAKETTAKKATAKKTTAEKKTTTAKKTTTKKTAAKAKELTAKVVLQYQHIEVEETELLNRFKGIWAEMGRKESEITDLTAYVKPEEYCAYFVVNNIDTVRVFL